MAEPKPVTVYRSGLTGRWYVTARGYPYNQTGTMIADARSKREVANSDQLEAMWDDYSWLRALLRFTGKTREEIAEALDCVIAPKDSPAEVSKVSEVPAEPPERIETEEVTVDGQRWKALLEDLGEGTWTVSAGRWQESLGWVSERPPAEAQDALHGAVLAAVRKAHQTP